MYKLQNVMSAVLERDNAYEEMFKDVKTMVNSKWALGPSQRVLVTTDYFELAVANIYLFAEYHANCRKRHYLPA